MPLPATRAMLTKLHELRALTKPSASGRAFGFSETAIALVLCISSLGLYICAVLFVVGFPTIDLLFIAAVYFGDVAIVFGVLWLLVVLVGSWMNAWPSIRDFTLVQSDIIDRDEANGPTFRRFIGSVGIDEVEERVERIKHHMSDLKSRGVFIAAIGGAITSATASKLAQELTASLKNFDISFIGIGLLASAVIGGLFYRYAELRFRPLVFELERALAALRASTRQATDVKLLSSGSHFAMSDRSPDRQRSPANLTERPLLAHMSLFGLAGVAGWILGALTRRR